MPIPRPESETRSEWLNRCIPVVINEGTTDRQDQAAAICISMWDKAKKEGRQRNN